MSGPEVVVFAGGVSGEREVSLRSARCVADALAASFPVEVFEIGSRAVPSGVDPERHVVFSTLHGTFGEDGGMQRLLEARAIQYAGSDADASELCMDKSRAKARMEADGIRLPRGRCFPAEAPPCAREAIAELGPDLVLKPNGEGSSLGLRFVRGEAELEAAFGGLASGDWLLEARVAGRELTVGVLDGRAMGVVGIVPESGCYDYESKYTRGRTRYEVPAAVPEDTAGEIRETAERAFALCGCRDFARVDFILADDGARYVLEINTLPGLTDTSLLPKSASCSGLDFQELSRRLIMPAVERFRRTRNKIKL